MKRKTRQEMIMSELTKELIQHSLEKDYNKASNVFGQIMNVKITDILDQEKIKMADQIYNGAEDEEDEEQLELDVDTNEGDDEVSGESSEDQDPDEEGSRTDDEAKDDPEETEEE